MLSLAQHPFSPVFGHMTPELRSPFSDPPRSSGHGRIQTSGLQPIDTQLAYSGYSSGTASPTSATSRRSIGALTKSPHRSRPRPYEQGKRGSKGQDSRSGTESATEGRSTSGPIRRRISRACDQCNQLRTKCDGMQPCSHCVEFGLACEYFRERKKRGKASRKDIAAQQARAAAAAAAGGSSTDSPHDSSGEDSPTQPTSAPSQEPRKRANSDMVMTTPQALAARARSQSSGTPLQHHAMMAHEMVRTNSMSTIPDHVAFPHAQDASSGHMDENGMVHMNGWQQLAVGQLHTPGSDMGGHGVPTLPSHIDTSHPFPYGTPAMHMMTPTEPSPTGFSFPTHMEGPMPGFMGGPPSSSPPPWLAMSSPNVGSFGSQPMMNPTPNLRYPVLQPLLPRLANVLPTAVACELLELYFTSSTSAFLHPTSPYLLSFVFRKRSFLHPTHPRKCSPALLSSMLWVAAQTSNAPFLTSPPSARARICQKLLELTVSLLQPLIHSCNDPSSFPNNYEVDGFALAGLGITRDHGQLTSETGGVGTLDDVATYIHLATVVSASEHKAASMRWWNVAFTLARELKLGRELPSNGMPGSNLAADEEDADGELDVELNEHRANGMGYPSAYASSSASGHSEEKREERRRIWWLLYTVDRHLALCYNRPLFLLDVECSDLFQPVSDNVWQAGDYYPGPDAALFSDANGTSHCFRPRGPIFECTSHGIFGFFTPLMTILGEIVELQQARHHPRFGLSFFATNEEEQRAAEITRHLETYEQSLTEFEARHTRTGSDTASPTNPAAICTAEAALQTKTMVAYGMHVMHVLHILLTGKWDPISLLDDSDLWISSQPFVFATQHAVSGAEAVARILELDPDLNFMPWFFGIYLLQGSFLLLLIADKLRSDASPSVIGACEVVVRAIEACVATLSTEYQRNFRKVMRSALAQVKNRIPEDFGEQSRRRRELLALYRWTGNGTGLAL